MTKDNLPVRRQDIIQTKPVKSAIQEESEEQIIDALKENILPHAKKFLKPAYKELAKYMAGDSRTFIIKMEEDEIYFINVPTKDMLPIQEAIIDDSKMKAFPVQCFMEALITGDFSVFEGDEPTDIDAE